MHKKKEKLTEKICRICQQQKSIEDFPTRVNTNKNNGKQYHFHYPYCRPCYRDKQRVYMKEKGREYFREKQAKLRKKGVDELSDYYVLERLFPGKPTKILKTIKGVDNLITLKRAQLTLIRTIKNGKKSSEKRDQQKDAADDRPAV